VGIFPKAPEPINSEAIKNATLTYCGRLVPISRWVRLIENSDRMVCCSGFKYDTFKDGYAAEPTAATRIITKRDKKGIEFTERKVLGIHPIEQFGVN